MKNRIIKILDGRYLIQKENLFYPHIYVADLSNITKNQQGINIFDTQPFEVEALHIENPNLDISATFFLPQCFLDENGKEIESCEGVFYLTDSTDKTWVLFIELKDCKVKNISRHSQKAIEQIKSTVQFFRDKKIIRKNKIVYANIAFPRRKSDYYSQVIKQPKAYVDEFKIILKGTNYLKIKNSRTII
ncbi:MAG: hypothetical protein LBE56_03230 [Tannerella sp.]|jgi:hypothetical protein|nr:hypothetical protein [Tannerella sp.]